MIVASTLVALSAASADAQVMPNRFQVVIQGGWQSFAGGSGLGSGPTIALEATYFLKPSIGFGLWTDFTVAESNGEKFTPAAFSFVDSTTFHSINQSVDIWQYGVQGKLQLARRTAPFLVLGAGGYTVFLDPLQNYSNSSTSGFVLRFGGGVDFAVTDDVGVELAVYDSFYPDWDPNVLLPVREEFQNTRFPELNPDSGQLSRSVHNFRFVAGLTLVPGF
jgi:opacity protein-like surface antigen